MKKKYIVLIVLIFTYNAIAGTIFFKDTKESKGKRISGVEIVSIADGKVIIEKDKAKRTYSIGKIKSYYQTDLKNSDSDFSDSFSDYKVTIRNVDMPKDGYNNKKKKTEKCEIDYSISRKTKGKKIKIPYFYLYVLVPGKDEGHGRTVYRYYYPKQAKPKGKDYDEAAIMLELSDFGRPIWHAHSNRIKGGLSGKKVTFSLSGIKNRTILAWHLEVWGNDEIVAQKNEFIRGLKKNKAGKTWWKRHKSH